MESLSSGKFPKIYRKTLIKLRKGDITLSEKQKTNISKYIALVLRHKPEEGNLTLDKEGYCPTVDLVRAVKRKFTWFTLNDLYDIVNSDEKGRYSFDIHRIRIRANQGHSTNQVDLTFKEVIPPDILYHGTATRFLNDIYREGLKPMSRQYVHLSKDIETATRVGERHGMVRVLNIDAKKMYEDGYKFYLSENNVYLVKEVPQRYFLSIDARINS